MQKGVFSYVYDAISDAATREEVEELLGLCESLKSSKYNHPEQYMDWCKIYKNAGKYDMAIEICNRELKQETDPERIQELQEKKFLLCCHAKLYSEAFHLLPSIRKSGEDLTEAIFYIGKVYEWAGQYEEAEKWLKKILERFGDHDSYQDLEEYYFRRGQWDKVEELAEEEIRLNGQSAYVYINLFNLYIEMGKYDKALEYAHLMNKYAKLDYIKRQYHLCLGDIYMGKEDYVKALECFEQSEREHCPVKTWDSMADCNVALGKYREAIVFYEKEAYREEDVNIYCLCVMQHCYFLMDGQPNIKLSRQIQKETEKQMLLSPDKMRQYNCYLGEAMASRGMFEQAESYFRQAEYEKMCPECGRCQKITWGKAWLLLYQGKYKEAMDVFERAVEINKSEQTVYVEYLALKQIGKSSAGVIHKVPEYTN
ncbi:MAG: tetratricopeptide repeat protein [Lachnospiraceae bacterium]|nr:tetratricopeptide repeat protein [Lachnospiraceae bacterium]